MTDSKSYGLQLQPNLSAAFTETELKNRELIIGGLNAMVAGNADGWWALYEPDVVFHEAACLPYGGVHKGLEAAKRAHEKIHEVFDGLSAHLEQVLAGGDLVIAYQTVTFKASKTGKTATLPVSEVFRMRNGKIFEWRAMYFDSNLVASLLS